MRFLVTWLNFEFYINFLGLAIAAGVKLGLFEGLGKHTSVENPLTSEQFADNMDLRERYLIKLINKSIKI